MSENSKQRSWSATFGLDKAKSVVGKVYKNVSDSVYPSIDE